MDKLEDRKRISFVTLMTFVFVLLKENLFCMTETL